MSPLPTFPPSPPSAPCVDLLHVLFLHLGMLSPPTCCKKPPLPCLTAPSERPPGNP